MILKFIKKHSGLTFSLVTLFLLASCVEGTQDTPTETPQPTSPPLTGIEQNTMQPEVEQTQATPTMTPQPTSTPFPEIDLSIDLPEGDPEKGYITAIQRGCFGCHTNETHPERAPRFAAFDDLPNIFERGETRIADPNYEGRATTNWEYVIESIRLPEIYLAPGDWEEAMSFSIYNPITDEELTDIIAWMKSLE